MTVLCDATFVPRTELEFSYCFRKSTETVDLNDAVQKCGEKVTGLVDRPLHPTITTLGIGFGQANASIIQAVLVKKVGEISIWTEAFATDGYAPQDHGEYAASIIANPIQQKLPGNVSEMLGSELDEIEPAEWPKLLKQRFSKYMAVPLLHDDQPVAVC